MKEGKEKGVIKNLLKNILKYLLIKTLAEFLFLRGKGLDIKIMQLKKKCLN